MPVRSLPSNPNLDHLKYQAKDLLKEHSARSLEAAQRMREFHPRFCTATDDGIFDSRLSLSDAQLAVAREHGFASWARLKAHVEKPVRADRLNLPYQERIEDATFRHAVKLLDAGDEIGLRAHLKQHPNLARQHVTFEGGNYFQNPTLLEFIAENPVRHGTLPENIVQVAEVILDAGVEPSALNETLALIATGRVPRECGVQLPLIDLLCDRGADANFALHAAALHGEFEAVNVLMKRGARSDLAVAASLGLMDEARRLLPNSNHESRHLALALAAQFGYAEIVRLLLDAGEDPNRYNPVGGHSHSTPLHQAAGAGHDEVVRALVERGARLDLKDIIWRGTPADWASHAGKTEIENYLRGKMKSGKQE
jgi:hypothetical protein